MSLQKYIALLKTVELGSISLAAEQMGYTQPAVSRMISDLEKEWQVELLRRSRAGLEVSSVCQRILPILRTIVADCEELEFTINEHHDVHTGLVRVGCFTSVADMWIPGLLKSFQQMYPNIEFDLINSETYAEIEDWIRHGKVDCGFVSLPTTNHTHPPGLWGRWPPPPSSVNLISKLRASSPAGVAPSLSSNFPTRLGPYIFSSFLLAAL